MKYIIENKLKIVIGILLIIIMVMAFNKGKESAKSNETVLKTDIIKALPTPPEVPKKEAVCTENEVKMVVNESVLFADANLVILNLDNFELTKTYVSGGKRYTRYRQFGSKDRYYTEAVPLPKQKKFVKLPSK